MLYLLFLLKWICSIQKVYFDVKKATFFLSATVPSVGSSVPSARKIWITYIQAYKPYES